MNFFAQHHNDFIFILATLFGMIGHYFKQLAKNQTSVSLKQWFGSSGISGTIASFTTALITIVGALASGIITPEMTFWVVVYTGLTTGFTVDAAANHDGTTAAKPVDDTQK